ncbi:hypothetical protein [Flavobacterium sp. N1736]|uniref:hypothetical protein n=1 Tax=Flavobacterium sp. N1736 TaxID=2986823 RepID=UPI0022258A2D|nr:hypothetical protein [Flavobacterium sp. N1736]
MKITKTVLLVFLVSLINISSILADTPAPPTPLAPPPPPPGGAIDQNLIFLFLGALIFGTYTIVKYNNMKKASM